MAASSSDLFMEVGDPGTATTLSAPGYTIGGTSLTVGSTANWPTTTGVIFAMDEVETVDGVETQVEGSYNEYAGVVASGTSITGVTHERGTDQNFTAGTSTRVYIPVSAERENRIAQGMVAEHNQDGTHAAITTTSINNAGALTQTGALTLKSYDGWIYPTDTWTYASATTFTIAGVDRTSQFPVGTKIKLVQTTTKYFYVTAAAFGTDTTVTITGGSDYSLANAAITSPAVSYMSTPQGFPHQFNYTPTYSGVTTTSGTVVSNFSMMNKQVTFEWQFILGGSSAISDGATITIPVTAASKYGTANTVNPVGHFVYNDITGSIYIGTATLAASTTVLTFREQVSASAGNPSTTSTNNPVAEASGDVMTLSVSYRAA